MNKKRKIKRNNCEHCTDFYGATALPADKGRCCKCKAFNKQLFEEIKECKDKFCTDFTHLGYKP